MQEDIEIIKQIIEKTKLDIEADYLKNPASHLKERADKIILRKKREIRALENVLKVIESEG